MLLQPSEHREAVLARKAQINEATSAPGGTTNYNFNVQAMAINGSLWLRNPNSNGIKIPDDAASTPTFTYNSQTNTGQRFVYLGIGRAGTITSAQERLLRIAPNPFTDRTTLYYALERAGRAQLLVNRSDGRDLFVLSDAQREAGAYEVKRDTNALLPGMYYVTLLLDGEPVVKRGEGGEVVQML